MVGTELYDLEVDPHEYMNVARNSSYTNVLPALVRLWRGGWQKARLNLPRMQNL